MQKWIHLITAAIVASTASSIVYAQQESTPPHSATTIPPSARFEIIQSHLAAKWTFRLDRVCGHVVQLIGVIGEDVKWEEMIVVGLPKCSEDGKARYQAFSSSLAAKHTFLMNLDTGKTWRLTNVKFDETDQTVWVPLKE